MNKKIYTMPLAETIVFGANDIITSSKPFYGEEHIFNFDQGSAIDADWFN